jgi:GT2 family glycosyltransferase
MNNAAARAASGDLLAFLNNDLEVTQPGWLRAMVGHAVRREVGAVGAKLLYPDGRVQHAGLVTGPRGYAEHLLRFADGAEAGYFGQLLLTRAVSAVTGACMVLRREVFNEVGGFEAQLKVTYNDIDLCLRLRDHGYRIVWTPAAELLHLECATRGVDEDGDKLERAVAEWKFMHRRWGSLMYHDPYHNPNVELQEHPAKLASPPRRTRTWLRTDAADNPGEPR